MDFFSSHAAKLPLNFIQVEMSHEGVLWKSIFLRLFSKPVAWPGLSQFLLQWLLLYTQPIHWNSSPFLNKGVCVCLFFFFLLSSCSNSQFSHLVSFCSGLVKAASDPQVPIVVFVCLFLECKFRHFALKEKVWGFLFAEKQITRRKWIFFQTRKVIRNVSLPCDFVIIRNQYLLSIWYSNNVASSWFLEETKCIPNHKDFKPLNAMICEQKVVISVSQNMKIFCLITWIHLLCC